jgi:methionine-rich copper-binding protein CopC
MRRFFAAAALSLIAAILFVGVVLGHSRPIRFDPAPGAVLNVAPSQVTGWFTQPLRRDANWNFIQVTNEQGTRVDSAELILSADRKQMTVNLNSNLPPGRYLVTWRTWDDNDGAIFGDCYAFFVGQAAADAALTANARLDGGGACQRIDVSGREGTPVAGGTPQATPVGEHSLGEPEAGNPQNGGDDGSGVPVWGLMLGVAGGVAVGLVGGRFIGARP